MKVAAPLALVASLAACLPGCVSEPAKSEAPPKPGDYDRSALEATNCTPSCAVTVHVPPSCGSGIRVTPDPIVVTKGRRTRIQWSVAGRWEFDRQDGVYIHAAQKAFSERDRSSDGRTFTVFIQHGDPAAFKYDINLVGPGGARCRIDPIIVNW